MVVQVGGLFFGDVGKQVDQGAGVDELLSRVAAVEQIGIVFTSDLGAQSFVQVAYVRARR